MPKVEMQGLKKIYDNGVEAVHDFNLEIEEGEFVVLVGPSAAGRRELRMVAGLEDITSGRLIIDEKDVDDAAQGQGHRLCFPELRASTNT